MSLLFKREAYVHMLQKALGSEREDWVEDLFVFVDYIVEKQMSFACRQCFVPFWQGMGKVTYSNIAKKLGISASAVSAHIQKGHRLIRFEFGYADLGYVGDDDKRFIEEQVAQLVAKAMKPVEITVFPRDLFLARIDEDRLPKYVHDLLNSYLFNGELVLGLHGSLEHITGFGRNAVQHVRDYLEPIGLADIESVPLDVIDALLQKKREWHQ